MSLWPFKRREWENRGKYLTNDEIQKAFIRWFKTLVPIEFKDPGKRCIERDIFEELARAWSRPVPDHCGNPRCDCDKRAIMRLGDIYRGWSFESRGSQALGVGYIDLRRKGSEIGHEEIYWLGPDGSVELYDVTKDGIEADRANIDQVFKVRA